MLHKFLIFLLLAQGASIASAEMTIPANADFHLSGGQMNLGCTDIQASGAVATGAGGLVDGVRSIAVLDGGTLDFSGGQMELAQQFSNAGTVIGTAGALTRVDSAGCPASGKLGPVAINALPVRAAPVPVWNGIAIGLISLILAGAGSLRLRRRRG